MVEHESTVFAPMFWGFVASIFLAGITVVQAYVYFPNQKDGGLVLWTAVCMLIMDLASSALIAQSIYFYLIPEFGSFEPLRSVTPELTVDCLISATITFISQLYFVHQLAAVRRLGKGKWIAIWVTLVSAFLGFAGGLGCVAAMFKFNKSILSSGGRSLIFTILFSLAKGWAAIADVVATVAMCMWLTSSKAGIKETNSLLSKLMMFVVQRGVLVTTIQVLLLVTFYAAPNSLAWFALHMNVTKLYANTFFAMLNGRTHLRESQRGTIISGAQVPSGNHFSFGVMSSDSASLGAEHGQMTQKSLTWRSMQTATLGGSGGQQNRLHLSSLHDGVGGGQQHGSGNGKVTVEEMIAMSKNDSGVALEGFGGVYSSDDSDSCKESGKVTPPMMPTITRTVQIVTDA
ncbi:hypothetical protein FA15DRAFT_516056 [Coprinopsis marcescibilis]|uniref:DUF6534 domain-containing protein n=1 Tax=Coprinopsis marcescibilis TaxID=230819 RepID=A0A5C3KQX0_COPMA|nr:hypothetical protein FA15DRAFT_516056 [Coprinopsis marcescibilis]